MEEMDEKRRGVFKEKGFACQASKKDRCEWWGFVKGNAWGIAWGMSP